MGLGEDLTSWVMLQNLGSQDGMEGEGGGGRGEGNKK